MSKEDRQKEYELRQEARQKTDGGFQSRFFYIVYEAPTGDRKIVKLRKFVSKTSKGTQRKHQQQQTTR